MKRQSFVVAAIAGILPISAHATLTMWQSEVAAGTASVATNFTAVSSPILFDVGTFAVNAPRTFEFVFNADPDADGAVSSAFIGTQSVANGRQGLKLEQWNNTGMIGVTAFGVADHVTVIASPANVDAHVVFTYDGADTKVYANGVLGHTFAGFALALTGEQGLGAGWNPDTSAYFDILPGTIYGFASYGAALGDAEVLAHYNAFVAIPEPGAAGLAALAGLGLIARRSRRIS